MSYGEAPGTLWMRTEFGWKPLSELKKKGFNVQPVRRPPVESKTESDPQITEAATAAAATVNK